MTGTALDSGKGHDEGGDVCQRVQIGSAVSVTHPKPFLSGSLKAGVVAFTFRAQGISPLELGAFPVNGESVVIGNRLVFCAAPVFLAVVPVFVVTGAAAGFGLPEGAAELLAQASVAIGCLAILVHGKARVANRIAGREFSGIFGIAFVQRDEGLTVVYILDQVVDFLYVVALIAQKSALLKGKGVVGSGEYLLNDSRIRRVGRGGQLVKRQTGNAVHQHMVFISPVKLISSLVVLVGCGMNTQSAVRVGFGMVLRLELIRGKGFWIVLLCVRRNGSRVQADKGSVHNAQLVQLFHLMCHDFFQFPVVQFLEKTVISPVGWQRLHDVEAAVVSDDPVVVQIIRQIGDLRKALAFHHDKCADHCFFWEATPSGCRFGQRKVQIREQLVIEHSGALRCEQCYILNDFLSVDSGQPLSVWFCCKLILP